MRIRLLFGLVVLSVLLSQGCATAPVPWQERFRETEPGVMVSRF